MIDLKAIYLTTLARCAPGLLVRRVVTPDLPRSVVAIGKCAGALLDGVAAVHPIDHAFVAVPRGYPLPQTNAEVHEGGHPQLDASSFAAGRALLRFAGRHDDLLFLISGGGSACVEVPVVGRSEAELIEINRALVASELSIHEINAVRKRYSAIKGGRLGHQIRGRVVTLVFSDVATGALDDVASGPTIVAGSPDADVRLIADNATLVATAAEIAGSGAVVVEAQIENDVESAARFLFERARSLQPGQILVAGGEPTVAATGGGKGGRCSELALRFLRVAHDAGERNLAALFGSSDGVDGNSGAAGIHLPAIPASLDLRRLAGELAVSNSFPMAAAMGEPIMMRPTGNNLRDLHLLARG